MEDELADAVIRLLDLSEAKSYKFDNLPYIPEDYFSNSHTENIWSTITTISNESQKHIILSQRKIELNHQSYLRIMRKA